MELNAQVLILRSNCRCRLSSTALKFYDFKTENILDLSGNSLRHFACPHGATRPLHFTEVSINSSKRLRSGKVNTKSPTIILLSISTQLTRHCAIKCRNFKTNSVLLRGHTLYGTWLTFALVKSLYFTLWFQTSNVNITTYCTVRARSIHTWQARLICSN